MGERFDTVVIGAGQAGLAVSTVLHERGIEHVVLERHRVGGRWRTERWDSLRFQFPNWSMALPGWSYAGDDDDGFASWRDVLGVIEGYAARARAPVREQCAVTDLRRDGPGFALSTPDGTIRAAHVVVATGPFQRPSIPAMSASVPPSVTQTDPTCYRGPTDLPDGTVLVVGSGASGCQIAEELLRAGRTVFLSVSRHRRVPRRFRGKDVYWWLDRMGRFSQTIDSFPGRVPPPSTVVTGVDGGYDVDVRAMAAQGVRVVGRVRGVCEGTFELASNANEILDEADAAFAGFVRAAREFAASTPDADIEAEQTTATAAAYPPVTEVESLDPAREHISAVVWATGYRYDYGWLHAPVLDDAGRPIQRRGVSPVPGLYFLGLHWMHTFKSGLFSGVAADAEYLADRIGAANDRG